MSPGRTLALPPLAEKRTGETRRVGVELEFADLGISGAVEVLKACLSSEGCMALESEWKSRYEVTVNGDPRGNWRIEVDSELLKGMAAQAEERADEAAPIAELAEELVDQSVRPLVPLEIVSPPLPMDTLDTITRLTEELRAVGASGTGDSWAYAFGLHLNPELPAEDPRTITAYLKAFLLIFEWLSTRSSVDLTRRVLPYINSFPDAYARRVAAPDYWPDQDTLLEDYLTENPTRNRPLDMLPLFAHLDSDHVARHAEDARIKARPTLHYRLPNFDFNNEDWSFGRVWQLWLEVEKLACDTERLNYTSRAYAQLREEAAIGWKSAWLEWLERELEAS